LLSDTVAFNFASTGGGLFAQAKAVLAQLRVDSKTNEHKAALELLGILPP
jgi:hypothetical protein